MKDIVIYGAGGSGREVACALNSINKVSPVWNLLGFLDDGLPVGTENEYGIIIGDKSFLGQYLERLAVVIAIGNAEVIKKIVDSINRDNIWFPNIIAPEVRIADADHTQMGRGNVIFNNTLLSINTKLGDFNFLDSCECGHDSCMGDYNVLMTGTKICGGVKIGDGNFFGINSVVLQYHKVGNNVKVGAGSIVMRDTEDDNLYIGNPAIKARFGGKTHQ